MWALPYFLRCQFKVSDQTSYPKYVPYYTAESVWQPNSTAKLQGGVSNVAYSINRYKNSEFPVEAYRNFPLRPLRWNYQYMELRRRRSYSYLCMPNESFRSPSSYKQTMLTKRTKAFKFYQRIDELRISHATCCGSIHHVTYIPQKKRSININNQLTMQLHRETHKHFIPYGSGYINR